MIRSSPSTTPSTASTSPAWSLTAGGLRYLRRRPAPGLALLRLRTSVRRRAAVTKYQRSPKGKAMLAKYKASPERKASLAKYDASPKGRAAAARQRKRPEFKAAQTRYARSPKGRISAARSWRKRRALERGAATQSLPSNYIDILFKRQAGLCYLCCEELPFGGNFHLEHKTPLSRGGAHVMDNFGVAHATCNLTKSTMTHAEWFFGRNP